MRKKTKLFILLPIFVLAILCGLYYSKFDVAADTPIDKVTISVPTLDEDDRDTNWFNISYGVDSSNNHCKLQAKNVDNDATYIRNGIEWYEFDNRRDMRTVTFAHARRYKLILYIEAKSGYTLPQDESDYAVNNLLGFVSINVSGYSKGDKTKAQIEIIAQGIRYYGESGYNIVSLSQVVEPIEGQNPVYSAYNNGSGCYWIDTSYNPDSSPNVTKGILWEEKTGVGSFREMESTDRFQLGKTYRVRIGVELSSGYVFRGESSGTSASEYYKINGSNCFRDRNWITRIFYCKEALKNADITNVIIPADGLKPEYDKISVSDKDSKYEIVTSIKDGNYKNGVEWGEMSGDVENPFNKSLDTKFLKDHEYYVKIVLKPKEKEKFSTYLSDINATVNGAKAEVIKYSDSMPDYIVVKKRFISRMSVSDLDFMITSPEIGKKPVGAKISTSLDKALAISNYGTLDQWQVSTDGKTYNSMNYSSVFESNKYYRCIIASDFIKAYKNFSTRIKLEKEILNPNVATAFSNNVTFTINGEKVTGEGILDFGRLEAPQVDISKAEVTGIVDKEYIGSPIPQNNIVVKLGDKILERDCDYEVSYSNNTEVGEATVTITGIGDYKGTIIKTFKITAKGDDPKKDDPTNPTDPKKDDPSGGKPTTEQPTTQGTSEDKKVDGVGTISKDGKTLTDETGAKYAVAEKVTNSQLKKNAKIADKKSGGKYKITKIVKNKKTGKVTGGTVEYIAPYNKNTKLISATGKVKLGGVTFTVTSIGNNCAKNCKNLTKVVLGGNITNIGRNAFSGCGNLKSIQIKSKKLKKVGANAFKGINKKATIKVPKAKKKAYTKLLKGKGQAKTVKIK